MERRARVGVFHATEQEDGAGPLLADEEEARNRREQSQEFGVLIEDIMKRRIHMICLLSLVCGCAHEARVKAGVARAEGTPQIATERNEPVLKHAPLDPDQVAALEAWRKSPFFGLCEQFGWRPRKPQCTEVELYLLEHKKDSIVPSRCFKITEPPWSEAVALKWGFYVHERFSITDFEDLIERPDTNDPDYSARTNFLPSAERWRLIRPHLSDDDEIWTVGASPSAWGFIIVSKGSPICFVFTDASY